MNAKQYAEEAQRLLDNDMLVAAFDRVRREALEALALAPATDADEIRRLQAIAGVVAEVRNLLGDAILSANQGGFDPNEPTG